MADENNSDLEDGEILDSESDGEVVDQSDQTKTCVTHTQNDRESRTMKRARDSSGDDGYREHSSSPPPAKKPKLNVAHDAATSSGGESANEQIGQDTSSEHDESGDEQLDADASYKYQSHSRGPSSSFNPAAPFGIQPRTSMPYAPVRHFLKKPLLPSSLGKEEEDEDDFDRQLSRERQRQMEMSHRSRNRDDYGSRHDDYHFGENDGYMYGMRESEDDYRGYRSDFGRGRSSNRHDYDRDVEESESNWSHGRDHSGKESSRHRSTALPSLMSSSRRPDVAVAAAEGDNSAFTESGRRSERSERSASRSARREQKAKEYLERSRQWEQEKGQRKNVRSSIPCKFYQEGRCNKGSDCPFSHDGKPKRKRELCKFYSADACSRGDECLYMHEEFPCKFFHTGNYCFSGSACRFSHEPLTEETRSLLDKVLEPPRNAVDFTSDRMTTEAAFSSDSFALPESHGLPQRSGLIAVPTLYHSVEDDYIEDHENDEEEEELRIDELLAEEDAHRQRIDAVEETAETEAASENETSPEDEEQEIFIYRPFGGGPDAEGNAPDKQVPCLHPSHPSEDSDVEDDAPLMIDVGTPTEENLPSVLSLSSRQKEDPLQSPDHVPFGRGLHKAARSRLPLLPPLPKGDLSDQSQLSAGSKDDPQQPTPSALPGNASPHGNMFVTKPPGYRSPHHPADVQLPQTSAQTTSMQLASQASALELATELSSSNSSDFTRQHLTLLKRFVAAVESKFSEKERQAATNPSAADVDMRNLLEEAAQQLKMDSGESTSANTTVPANSTSARPDDPRRRGQLDVTGVPTNPVSEVHPPQPVAMYLNDAGRSSPLHTSQQSQPADPRVARRMANTTGSQSPGHTIQSPSIGHVAADLRKGSSLEGQSWSSPNLGLGAVSDSGAHRDPRRRPAVAEPSTAAGTSAAGGRKGLLPTPPAHMRLPVASDTGHEADSSSVAKDRRATGDPRGGDQPWRETDQRHNHRSDPRSSSRSEHRDSRSDSIRGDNHSDRFDPRAASRSEVRGSDPRAVRSDTQPDRRGDRHGVVVDESHSGHSLGPRSSGNPRHAGLYSGDPRGSGSQETQTTRHDPRAGQHQSDTSSETSMLDSSSTHLTDSWPNANYRKPVGLETGQENVSWTGPRRGVTDPRYSADQRLNALDQKLKGWHADSFRNADPTASPFG